MIKTRKLLIIFITWIFIFSGLTTCSVADTNDNYYSFESDMDGWDIDSTDTELGDGEIDWHINRSTERATDGDYSLEFFLANWNGAGKIWIEKEFELNPNTQYEIVISYNFATSDYGIWNLFQIIAGVSTKNPETMDDLSFQDDTGHHQGEEDYIWLNKSYKIYFKTNDDGLAYVAIGVWGTWDYPRTYFIDEVKINITNKPIPILSVTIKDGICFNKVISNVENMGDAVANNVTLSLSVVYGFQNHREEYDFEFDVLEPSIVSKSFIIKRLHGFGKITVTAKVYADYVKTVETSASGWIIGRVIILI